VHSHLDKPLLVTSIYNTPGVGWVHHHLNAPFLRHFFGVREIIIKKGERGEKKGERRKRKRKKRGGRREEEEERRKERGRMED
jgi:hypothetical protein